MQKIIQNWESLHGNKTNTFVISGHVYFVCTTYVATAISYYLPSIFLWFYTFEMDTSVDKSADDFLSLENRSGQ
jgi:hypothetical protein